MSTPDNGGRHADADRTDDTAAVPAGRGPSLRHDVVEREKERFGGMKFGSAFFGWLSAMGMAVILTALVAAAGAAVGQATNVDTTNPDAEQVQTVSIIGAIALVVILFVSYYCGGYVAGRMARFNGAKQGLAVWLWALIIAILAAVLGAIAGAQFNFLANLNSFPRIPVSPGDLTVAGIITAIIVALVALAGAILGGLAGMRYHRRVDKVGLGA